jgi:hypothetical protein
MEGAASRADTEQVLPGKGRIAPNTGPEDADRDPSRHRSATREIDTMILASSRARTRLRVAAFAIAALALLLPAAPAALGAGLRNCVDVPLEKSGRVGCWEDVWAGGVEHRMTFSTTTFKGAAPRGLDGFYLVGAQTDAPQGAPPNTFAHDHVVRDVPAQNHGNYSVQLQGFFVLCSGQGIVSGACVPAWTFLGGPDPLPLAVTVNGQPLTSTDAIESAADAGNLALINLGPGAVIVGTISGN